MGTARVPMPRARHDEIIVEELEGETLVYDLERHKASCLNPTAALVWKHCDGTTSVAEVAHRIGEQLAADDPAAPVDEAVVWMALDRLSRAHLLSEPVTLPGDRAQYSRREVLRKLRQVAGISLLLPVIESIVAPLAAAQASCITANACVASTPPCTGLPICNQPGRCCMAVGPNCAPSAC